MSSTTPYQHTGFLNLPVEDLSRSSAFYTALGFVQNKTFSNEKAAQMAMPPSPTTTDIQRIHDEGSFKIMLLTHDFYRTFLSSGTQIGDAKKSTQMLLCISRESKEAVDEFLEKVASNGGKRDVRELNEADLECRKMGMYGELILLRGMRFLVLTFCSGGNATDPDGHYLEVVYMPPQMYLGTQ